MEIALYIKVKESITMEHIRNLPRNIIPLFTTSLIATALFACGSTESSPQKISKAEAQALGGVSNDGTDICDDQNWYADGACDSFCPKTDRECFVGGCYGMDFDLCDKTPQCTATPPPPKTDPTPDPTTGSGQGGTAEGNIIPGDNGTAENPNSDGDDSPPNLGPRGVCRPKDPCLDLGEKTCGTTDGCQPVVRSTEPVTRDGLEIKPTFSDFDYCAPTPDKSFCAGLDEALCEKNSDKCEKLQAPIECPEGRACITLMRFSRCVEKVTKPLPVTEPGAQ